jgi:hypothetical protein
VTGRSQRVGTPVAVAIAAVAVLVVILAGCGPAQPTPSPAGSVSGSLAPAATSERSPSPVANQSPSAAASPGAGVQVDPGLLDVAPNPVDGVTLTFDPDTSAEIAADPAVAVDAASLAVGLAVGPAASGADDLAIVSVVKLRDPDRDEAWFRDWRDTYDQAACSQAGGIIGNAEAELGGGTVYIGSCGGGALTYHTRLSPDGIVVSVTAVGNRRLGEKVMAGLHR